MGISVTGGVKFPQGLFSVGPVPVAPPAGNGLFAWGYNTGGYVGDGTTVTRYSPVQVGALIDWASVAAATSHSHALKTDGTLWGWGAAVGGRIGDETAISKSSPVQIGALTDWSKVDTGDRHTLALKTDGTLWAWGDGGVGRLGLGDASNRSSPVQIGGLTTWASVSAGKGHSHAIKTDGSLWAWGNSNGVIYYLGNGDPAEKSSPIQIGALTNWSSVSASLHTLAVKTDGTLWGWGFGSNGQIGNGTALLNNGSPVQVGFLTDWAQCCSAGASTGSSHSVAIKTDGTIWSWGNNNRGQLGQEDTIKRSSPVQIGILTDWVSIGGGNYHTLAVKTDGSLWGWGDNSPDGRIGLGDTTDRSSPVQIGSLTDWASVSAGNNHTLALKTV